MKNERTLSLTECTESKSYYALYTNAVSKTCRDATAKKQYPCHPASGSNVALLVEELARNHATAPNLTPAESPNNLPIYLSWDCDLES